MRGFAHICLEDMNLSITKYGLWPLYCAIHQRRLSESNAVLVSVHQSSRCYATVFQVHITRMFTSNFVYSINN